MSYQFDLTLDGFKPVVLPYPVLDFLYGEIDAEFSYLLETCYRDPDQILMSERPGLFEKFYYNEKWHTVNYTTSGLGHLMYTIDSRLRFIKQIVEDNGKLI